MSSLQERWHFPRTDLATSYIDSFDRGLRDIVAIFAPRRMGKTQFIDMDVAPLATGRGYTIVKIDFWSTPEGPAACILNGLQAMVLTLPASRQTRIREASALELSVSLSGVQASKSLGGHVHIGDELGKAFQKVRMAFVDPESGKPDGKLLILLDEIQALADGSPEGVGAAKALRTFLQWNQGYAKAIMTGSSRHGLDALFRDIKAAFYNKAFTETLPDLDMRFVDHMARTYLEIYGEHLNLARLQAAFKGFDYNPEDLYGTLDRMGRKKEHDITTGVAGYMRERNESETFNNDLRNMSGTTLLICGILSLAPKAKLYSREVTDFMTSMLSETITASKVQAGVNRLLADGFLLKHPSKGYIFENSGFERHVARTASSDVDLKQFCMRIEDADVISFRR